MLIYAVQDKEGHILDYFTKYSFAMSSIQLSCQKFHCKFIATLVNSSITEVYLDDNKAFIIQRVEVKDRSDHL